MDEFAEIYEYEELHECKIVQPKIYRERVDPFVTLTNREFRKRYRFTKDEARKIIEVFKNSIPASTSQRGRPISPELKILACLSGFGRNRVQEDSGDIHGFSQSTMSRINSEVSRAIALKLPEYIRFPQTVNEQLDAMTAFQSIAGMPQIIGAIDCTHIKIKKTGGEVAQMFINRKGFYSLNTQGTILVALLTPIEREYSVMGFGQDAVLKGDRLATSHLGAILPSGHVVVCDAECKITDIVACWRGSTHDSRIFTSSAIHEKFEAGQFMGKLIGDSGYTCSGYMLTPVLNPQSRAESKYNDAQIKTRNVVERLFGQWKQRFRGLLRGLYTSLDNVKVSIIAMAVLHNMAIEMRAEGEWSDEEDQDDDEDEDRDPEPPTTAAVYSRNEYIRKYF